MILLGRNAMDDPVYFIFLGYIGVLIVYGAIRLAVAYFFFK